jgi:hypothetical protein
MLNNDYLILSSSRRPAPKAHAALPPWDTSDSGGIVHTIQPAELTSIDMQADFAGAAIDLNRWNKQTLPYFKGANTTPPNAIMTPMLVLYPRYFQDAVLTEHAERGYDSFIIAPDGWNLSDNGFYFNNQSLINWISYINSWGFKTILWRSSPTFADPFLAVVEDMISFYIVAEELNSKISNQQLITLLEGLRGISIPVGVHFTNDYPLGNPLDTYLTDWSPYNGWVHLMQQFNQNDSAGTQSAKSYYARQRVNLGWQGEDDIQPSKAAPNSKVYVFEVMADAQLDPKNWSIPRPDAANVFGTCTEEYGCLRSIEALYATRDNPLVRPLAGFGNGARLPNGYPFRITGL